MTNAQTGLGFCFIGSEYKQLLQPEQSVLIIYFNNTQSTLALWKYKIICNLSIKPAIDKQYFQNGSKCVLVLQLHFCPNSPVLTLLAAESGIHNLAL